MPMTVHAHNINYPKRLVAELTAEKIRVSVGYDLEGEDGGKGLRERFDANRDGQVDQDEAELARMFVVNDVRKTLRVSLGTQPAALTLTSVSDRGLEGSLQTREHIQFEFVFETPSPTGQEFELSIRDEVEGGLGVVPLQISVTGLRFIAGSLRGVGSGVAALPEWNRPVYLLRGQALTVRLAR